MKNALWRQQTLKSLFSNLAAQLYHFRSYNSDNDDNDDDDAQDLL